MDNKPEEGGKRMSKWFAYIAYYVLLVLFKILFRFKAEGTQHLRAIGRGNGAVVVSNHTSFLDVIFLYLTVGAAGRWPRIIGKADLFDKQPWIFGWILTHVGVIPIERDSADRTAVKRAAKLLKLGEVVCILPEGTRRGKGDRLPSIHGGAALIARMGKAPIVPMTVRDAEKVKNKGERMHFPKVTMEMTAPLNVSDFDFLPKDERLDGCVWFAMRECFALFQRVKPDEVDMIELFPDSKDYSPEMHALVLEREGAPAAIEQGASDAQDAGGAVAETDDGAAS